MDAYQAIFKRRSVRRFAAQQLSERQFAVVEKSITDAGELLPGQDLRIHVAVNGERVQRTMLGLVGAYGKVRAPHYLIASAVPQGEYLQAVGYRLEHVILELTAAGIATCWIGAHLNQQPIHDVIELPVGHVPVLLVAMGQPEDPASLWRKDAALFKRKPLKALMLSEVSNAWLECLEAARLAPSAMNSQPWRFLLADDDTLHVYQVAGGLLGGKLLQQVNQVDMGIALQHIALAAEATGGQVRFDKQAAPVVPGCIYRVTVERRQ